MYPQGFIIHCPLKPPGLCPPGPSSLPAPARAPTKLLGAGHGFLAFNSPTFPKYRHHRQEQPRASSSFLSSPWTEKQRDFSVILVWFCFDDCTPQTGIFCNSYCNILIKCNIMDLCPACQCSSGKAHEGDQAMGMEISSWYFAGNEGPLINVKHIESIPVKI